ncbi:MAG: hypothetical protein WD266_11285 [Balneolales bacterium]
MQQATEQITNTLLENLPRKAGRILPGELADCGFPDYLVHYIRIRLEENLQNAMNPEHVEWVDSGNEVVNQAWQAYFLQIRPAVQLPYSQARPVIRQVVADVLPLLAAPRSSLAGFLFSGDETLAYDEIIRRCEQIPFYRHFGTALPRFMEKKKMTEISREQCAHFIASLDEKLVSRYSPVNWEKLLDPWFRLMGSGIPPSLLERFFEDKNEMEVAGAFGRVSSPLSKKEIIEIITQRTPAIASPSAGRPGSKTREDISEETIAGAVKDTQHVEENSIVGRALRDNLEEGSTLASNNQNSEDAETRFNALFSRFQKPDDDEIKSDDREALPMWRRFVPDDDPDAGEDTREEEPDPPYEPEAGTTEEPEPDQAVPEPPVRKSEPGDIFTHIDNDKDYFVENLFGGDEEVFHDVLEELGSCKKWKDAAAYLTENVFRRNFIDIYSEPAVDFTDRLQEYFNRK